MCEGETQNMGRKRDGCGERESDIVRMRFGCGKGGRWTLGG